MFLKKYFGKHWRIVLPTLFVIILWPAFFFYKRIEFVPALFVTNWINTASGTLLVAIILKIFFEEMIEKKNREKLLIIDRNINRYIDTIIAILNDENDNESFPRKKVNKLWEILKMNFDQSIMLRLDDDDLSIDEMISPEEIGKVDAILGYVVTYDNVSIINEYDKEEAIGILLKAKR